MVELIEIETKYQNIHSSQDIQQNRLGIPPVISPRQQLKLLCKMWSSHLLNHNKAAIELQIGPTSIHKQE